MDKFSNDGGGLTQEGGGPGNKKSLTDGMDWNLWKSAAAPLSGKLVILLVPDRLDT